MGLLYSFYEVNTCVGQSRKTLPDGFTSLLVKTRTVPPRGTSWILGALRLQAKLCGISEQVGAPEVQCA